MSDQPTSACNNLVEHNIPVRSVLDFVLSHAHGDERPYVTVSVFGKELLGLLDSGASHTIAGNRGRSDLQSIGFVNLEPVQQKYVWVANGASCECIGILRVPMKLRDVEKIIDILVVPSLNHSLILGIDFWLRMGIVPDLRSNEWKFHASDEFPSINVLEALNSLSSLTSE